MSGSGGRAVGRCVLLAAGLWLGVTHRPLMRNDLSRNFGVTGPGSGTGCKETSSSGGGVCRWKGTRLKKSLRACQYAFIASISRSDPDDERRTEMFPCFMRDPQKNRVPSTCGSIARQAGQS